MLEDEKSRNVFKGLLKYKISSDQRYIKSIVDPHEDMYFDRDLLSLVEHDTYVDVGAYIGDTLSGYKQKYGRLCRNYICFEPNDENLKLLKQSIDLDDIQNVRVVEKGISDKKRVLAFITDSGAATRVSNDGDVYIECTSIDEELLSADYDDAIIKMDIEGSEYEALKGAQKFISKYHPVLEICVYHKPDDIYKLPLFIKDLYAGYKLYFRQYELSVNETVCYAIPEDKCKG